MYGKLQLIFNTPTLIEQSVSICSYTDKYCINYAAGEILEVYDNARKYISILTTKLSRLSKISRYLYHIYKR